MTLSVHKHFKRKNFFLLLTQRSFLIYEVCL